FGIAAQEGRRGRGGGERGCGHRGATASLLGHPPMLWILVRTMLCRQTSPCPPEFANVIGLVERTSVLARLAPWSRDCAASGASASAPPAPASAQPAPSC